MFLGVQVGFIFPVQAWGLLIWLTAPAQLTSWLRASSSLNECGLMISFLIISYNNSSNKNNSNSNSNNIDNGTVVNVHTAVYINFIPLAQQQSRLTDYLKSIVS